MGAAGPTGGRVLFPKARAARDVIGPGLRAQGWDVIEVDAYAHRRRGASRG